MVSFRSERMVPKMPSVGTGASKGRKVVLRRVRTEVAYMTGLACKHQVDCVYRLLEMRLPLLLSSSSVRRDTGSFSSERQMCPDTAKVLT